MNYEEKYKKVLEQAKQAIENIPDKSLISWLENIFPELKESEDEKIRKEITEFLKRASGGFLDATTHCKTFGKWLTWLEKQGEQKPVEQDTEIHDLWVYIREWNDKFGRLPKDEDELASCIDYVMKRQKPAWSEEDEKKRRLLISILEVNHPNGYFKVNPANTLNMEAIHTEELVDWLKSIEPKKHWKPSKQNLKDLEWCADLVKDKMGVGFHRLQVFIDELKKL